MFAPLCHLPDVTAINFIWVRTASNICYHSSTEGQTDLFFAHSSVNHTESHLLNTSTDFPPDILLYWLLKWKPVVANIPRNFREYEEEQQQFFPLKAVEKQSFIPWEGSWTCQYPPPRVLQTSYDCHHIRLYIIWSGIHMDRLHRGCMLISQWVVMYKKYMASELEVCWKTPARCTTASLLRDAQSEATVLPWKGVRCKRSAAGEWKTNSVRLELCYSWGLFFLSSTKYKSWRKEMEKWAWNGRLIPWYASYVSVVTGDWQSY